MAEYMTLMGAEEVRSAGRQMASAADQMSRAASEMISAADTMSRAASDISAALQQHQTFLQEWVFHFEATTRRDPA